MPIRWCWVKSCISLCWLSGVVRCCHMLSDVEGVRWRKSFALLLLFPAHLDNLRKKNLLQTTNMVFTCLNWCLFLWWQECMFFFTWRWVYLGFTLVYHPHRQWKTPDTAKLDIIHAGKKTYCDQKILVVPSKYSLFPVRLVTKGSPKGQIFHGLQIA